MKTLNKLGKFKKWVLIYRLEQKIMNRGFSGRIALISRVFKILAKLDRIYGFNEL